jgi:hypothetical protein
MKFPGVEDAHLVVQQALHIRSPSLYPAVTWAMGRDTHTHTATNNSNNNQQQQQQAKGVNLLHVAALSSM